MDSDTLYPEVASDPTGEGLRPTRLAPSTSGASLQIQSVTHASERLTVCKSEVPMNLLAQLTEFMKTTHWIASLLHI